MRDGIIFGKGKSTKEWNYSAPHGAGRISSRGDAKKFNNMTDFIESMKGIYSTSVTEATLDESPMAYKNSNLIIEMIKDIIDIQYIGKSIYNIKG